MEEQAQTRYLRARKEEAEDVLARMTLSRLRHLTARMTPEERKAFPSDPLFQRKLSSLRRRDPLSLALERGDLSDPLLAEEWQELCPLILEEARAGLETDLSFCRSVVRCRYSLKSAFLCRRCLELHLPEKILSGKRPQHLQKLSGILDRAFETGALPLSGEKMNRASLVRLPGGILNFIMEQSFPEGLTGDALEKLLPESAVTPVLIASLRLGHPELLSCPRLQFHRVDLSVHLKRVVQEETRHLLHSLIRDYPSSRIRRHLALHPEVASLEEEALRIREEENRLQSALVKAVPERYMDLFPLARNMQRHFVLHVGPTNSGKTFDSLERLKAARRGLYLGPLRLLAFEQFETLNLADVPCTLLTGEEEIRVPGSRVQSSTVEMADLKKAYDIAVIDEAQLLSDRDRGGAWTAAILGLCASEIHLCASPDAENLLLRIIRSCGDSVDIVRHDRMTPLVVDSTPFDFPASVQPGDALIVFSKLRVHAVAGELSRLGFRVSLIYGALPPDVRRHQSERFRRGESDVLVSTDAIAMGLNLPIRRIVFLETEKFDGDIVRSLTRDEIRQIAGRAGRYGLYDRGMVNAYGFRQQIAQALSSPYLPLTHAVIRFPDSLLGVPMPLSRILEHWDRMPGEAGFIRASARRMLNLALPLENSRTDRNLLFRFVCIPFDESDPVLFTLWRNLYRQTAAGETADLPAMLPVIRDPEACSVSDLDSLEEEYRICDLLYNHARLFSDNPAPILEEIQRRKDLISDGIIHVLSGRRLLEKTCAVCGRSLPWNWPYPRCQLCHERRRRNA